MTRMNKRMKLMVSYANMLRQHFSFTEALRGVKRKFNATESELDEVANNMMRL